MADKKFVFCGGGTGGHIFPNIAIYQKLKQLYPQAKFYYFGSTFAEASIVRELNENIHYQQIKARGFPLKLKSLKTIKAIGSLLAGTAIAYFKLLKIKPDLIISSGGYVAAPTIFAARFLNIPVFVHEQNAIFGRLNRINARFAAKIGVTFKSTLDSLPPEKGFYCGYPVRENFFRKIDPLKLKAEMNIPADHRIIFFVGGSMGARVINQAAVNVLPELLKQKNITVIISTGKAFSKEYRAFDETVAALNHKKIDPADEQRIIIKEFFTNIEEIFAISDLIIARAGAGTINEILALKKLALLIPKTDLPSDHQILNAVEMKKAELADILLEDISLTDEQKGFYISEEKLLEKINTLLSDSELTKRIKGKLNSYNPVDCSSIFSLEIKNFLENQKQSVFKELKKIKVFFLREERSEQVQELVFDTTSFGNSALADFIIPEADKRTIFQIKILSPNNEEQLMLIPKCKEILLNNQPVSRPTLIQAKDQIGYRNYLWTLDAYKEEVLSVAERPLHKNIISSSVGIIISRIGGFIREIFTAAVFGAGKIMDIFSVGLNISNFMRRVVAENALENAFMPIFLRLFQRTSRRKTWQAAAYITNFSILLATVISILGIIFAPQIITLLFPGFLKKNILNEAVAMTRLLFPYLILVTFASVLTTYLKTFNQFRKAEASAIFFSIGSIIGIIALSEVAGGYALAFGVLLGGLLQILYLLSPVKRILLKPEMEFNYHAEIKFSDRSTRKYFTQLTPISLDVTISQIGTIADKFFASFMATGALSYLYYAMHIFLLPFAFISQAISNVVLKEFSSNIAVFNKDKSRKLFLEGITLNLFLLTPVTVLLIILARPIVSILLERFNFTSSAVTNTALALQYYSFGLLGWGLHNLSNRIFAARMELKLSLYINSLLLITHISLCYFLVKTPLEFAAIALATSISYSFYAVVRLLVLKQRFRRDQIKISFSDLLPPLNKTLLATILMLIAIAETKFILNYIEIKSLFLSNFLQLITVSFIGLAAYFLSSSLLHNEALQIFKKRKKTTNGNQLSPALLSPFKFLEAAQKNPALLNEYYYKINIYLRSPSWQVKNIGIKLIALAHQQQYVPFLINLLQKKERNHFLRRNALQTLQSFHLWNDEIAALLKKLLQDRYFEVRSAALKYLLTNMPAEEFAGFAELISKRLQQGNFEEKISAFQLITRKGRSSELKLIQPFLLSENSLIREAVLELLLFYYRRKIISREELKDYLTKVLTTSNNFSVSFRLKELYNNILKELEI